MKTLLIAFLVFFYVNIAYCQESQTAVSPVSSTGTNSSNAAGSTSTASGTVATTAISENTISSFDYFCSKSFRCSIVIENDGFNIRLEGLFPNNKDASKNEIRSFRVESDFSLTELNDWITSNHPNSNCQARLLELSGKIKNKIADYLVKKKGNQDQVIINNLIADADKDVYGGELVSINDTIPVYDTEEKAVLRGRKLKDTYLVLKKIRVQIDYNRIYDLTVDADLIYSSKEITDISSLLDSRKPWMNVRYSMRPEDLWRFNIPRYSDPSAPIPDVPYNDSKAESTTATSSTVTSSTVTSSILKLDNIIGYGTNSSNNNSTNSISFQNKISLVLSNRNYSLGLRSLNDGVCIRKIEVYNDGIISDKKDKDFKPVGKLFINYADILKYNIYEGEFAEILQNASYKIEPEKSVKVYKRALSDYISFRTFLDPLGFLSNNKGPNGFAQLEGDAIIPMRVNNYKQRNWFPQVNVNFSYIYANSINSDPRIAPVYSLTNLNPSSAGANTVSRFVNNIDVIKYRYYLLNAHLSIIGFEFKKAKSFLHLETGFQVAGVKAGQNNDSAEIINKFIPDLRARLELRPDYIIGSSLSIGIAYLGNSHRGNNSPFNPNDVSFLYKSSWGFPHELNVYSYTGKGRGGLFFRYMGWLAFNQSLSPVINSNLIPVENNNITKTSYFPQILVGYATNLSTLIKRASN